MGLASAPLVSAPCQSTGSGTKIPQVSLRTTEAQQHQQKEEPRAHKEERNKIEGVTRGSAGRILC